MSDTYKIGEKLISLSDISKILTENIQIELSDKASKKVVACRDYLNKKMEGLMAALFDTLGENEERIKDLELQVWKLTEKINGSSS